MAAAVVVGVVALGDELPEQLQRRDVFAEARAEANRRGKPLLNVGCTGLPRPFSYSCADADVCLDLDSAKLRFCSCQVRVPGSVLAIPYPDRTFGAAVCFHVLEHLDSTDQVEQAVHELERVADRVYILVPAHTLLATWHPDHRLWLDWTPDGYQVTDRQTAERRLVRVRDSQPPSAVLHAEAA